MKHTIQETTRTAITAEELMLLRFALTAYLSDFDAIKQPEQYRTLYGLWEKARDAGECHLISREKAFI